MGGVSPGSQGVTDEDKEPANSNSNQGVSATSKQKLETNGMCICNAWSSMMAKAGDGDATTYLPLLSWGYTCYYCCMSIPCLCFHTAPYFS